MKYWRLDKDTGDLEIYSKRGHWVVVEDELLTDKELKFLEKRLGVTINRNIFSCYDLKPKEDVYFFFGARRLTEKGKRKLEVEKPEYRDSHCWR